ncbi:hypothetical protein Zm00014a_020699 [Zea mays]|uniref:Uncharacterized protein n=1 Tax=Zea mays TaxID=4577 RepID=A0A3L6FX22_MAIZE|nr:hypothetical protein Zm00014a_020699 [Zea mays]
MDGLNYSKLRSSLRPRLQAFSGVLFSSLRSLDGLLHMASVAVLQFVHDPHDDPPVLGCVHLTLARVYALDRARSLSLVKDHFTTLGKDLTVIGYCCDDAEPRRRQLQFYVAESIFRVAGMVF